MGKRLHLDPAAEKEATDIGRQFMHSSDVVGDMSRAYGVDLSSVRIHTDEGAARAAAERGVDAYSTGKDVFFARGAFDRSDPASRGLLAHELSHSLQQGVGGPSETAQAAPMGAEQGGILDWFRDLFRSRKKPEDRVSFAEGGKSPKIKNIGRFFRENNDSEHKARFQDPSRQRLHEDVRARLADGQVYGNALSEIIQRPSGDVAIKGLNATRMITNLQGPLGGDMSDEAVVELYQKLLGGGRYSQLRNQKQLGGLSEEGQAELDGYTAERIGGLDARFDEGMQQLKGLQLAQLRRLKDKYGIYGSQMHPDDFITRLGPEFFSDVAMLQDSEQILLDGGRYFDFENSADDREYRALSNYYNDLYGTLNAYASTDRNKEKGDFTPGNFELEFFKTLEEPGRMQGAEEALRALGAQGFTEQEQAGYVDRVRKRYNKKKNWKDRLFGRFL